MSEWDVTMRNIRLCMCQCSVFGHVWVVFPYVPWEYVCEREVVICVP